MLMEEKYSALPNLPQFGDLRAACPAKLPSKVPGLAIAASIFTYLVTIGVTKVTAEKHFQTPEPIALLIGCVIGLVLGYVVYFLTKRTRCAKQGLFVFDGGIHMNEDVSYIVSYGQWMSFCTGMRQVSIPWRLISNFSAREFNRKGQPVVEASIKIPDGRTVVFATDQGEQAGAAITTLIEKLGRESK